MVSQKSNLHIVKGQSLAHLNLITRELWKLYESELSTPSVKLRVIIRLIQVLDKRLLILGLTPVALENLARDARLADDCEIGCDHKVMKGQKIRDLVESLSEYFKRKIQIEREMD